MTLRSAWPVCSRRRRLSIVRICSSRMTESFAEAHVVPAQRNVRRQARFAGLAGDGSGNNRRRMLIAGVVLHDEHRPAPALFAAHDRAQVGVKNVAAFHVRIHLLHTPRKKYARVSRRCFYSPTQRAKINKEPSLSFHIRMLPLHTMQKAAKNGGFSKETLI